MRRLMLIAGFVLASVTAQAGDVRSLARLDGDPQAAPAPAKTVDTTQTAQAPQVKQAPQVQQAPQAPQATEAPKAEASKVAPKYVERPALVEPSDDLTGLENIKPSATKTAPASRIEKPRRKPRYWTEDRIISELYRYGVYW